MKKKKKAKKEAKAMKQLERAKSKKLKISEHLGQADRLHRAASWHLCGAAMLARDADMSLDDLLSHAASEDLNLRCVPTIQLELRECFESLQKFS